MVNEEKQENIDELPSIETEDLPKVPEETPKQLSKYQFSLTPTCNPNVYKTIIEVSPPFNIGSFKSKKEKKYIVANKLELIAESPNFRGVGKITVNVLRGGYEGAYSFGKTYDNPQTLKRDYLKLITKIREKHMDNKDLKLKLLSLKSKPLNSKS